MNSEKSWEELEANRKVRWQKIADSIDIRWLKRHDFWRLFQETYRPKGRFLNRQVEFPIRLDDLRARIEEPPTFTPLEEDFPGPVERWYGSVSKHLFLLTHYYDPSYPEMTDVRMEDTAIAEAAIMKELIRLKEMNPYG